MGAIPWSDPQVGISGLESLLTLKQTSASVYAGTSEVVLNDKSSVERYEIRSIDGLHSLPPIQLAESALPGRDGVRIDDVRYGGRDVSVTGRIVAGNLAKLRAMEYELRELLYADISDTKIATLTPISGPDFVFAYRPTSFAISNSIVAGRVSSDFSIGMHCPDPRIYSATIHSRTIALSSGATVWTSIWDLPNNGSWYARPNIRISSGSSWVVSDLAVSLEQSGFADSVAMTYSGAATASAGNWVELWNGYTYGEDEYAVGAGQIKIRNASGWWGEQSRLNQNVAHSLVLPPRHHDPDRLGAGGGLSAYCSAMSGSAEISVQWRDTWI